jgi:hypothetical protein
MEGGPEAIKAGAAEVRDGSLEDIRALSVQINFTGTITFSLGIEVAPLEIRRAEDIAPAFETLKKGRCYSIST